MNEISTDFYFLKHYEKINLSTKRNRIPDEIRVVYTVYNSKHERIHWRTFEKTQFLSCLFIAVSYYHKPPLLFEHYMSSVFPQWSNKLEDATTYIPVNYNFTKRRILRIAYWAESIEVHSNNTHIIDITSYNYWKNAPPPNPNIIGKY